MKSASGRANRTMKSKKIKTKKASRVAKKKTKSAKPKSKPVKKIKPEILYKHADQMMETAAYYGFSPLIPPKITDAVRTKSETLRKTEREISLGSLSFVELEDRVAVLEDYQNRKMDREPQPILIAYDASADKTKKHKNDYFDLEIIGSSKSIADATIIKTVLEIVKDKGIEGVSVNLNSMGDRESYNRFAREFANFTKKNIEQISSQCRQNFKKDPLAALSCGHEKCAKALENAPKPLNFLSEPSRLHFKEVLEHLESLEVPYKIKNSLVADRAFGCFTIFEIVEESKDKILAAGCRYNVLARKIGFKKEIPAVTARLPIIESRIPTNKNIMKPLVAFVQIGFEAKLKSLQIIEILRKAKIPTFQSLSRDKLSSQLQMAENIKVPYAIIMGQMEAMSSSVIVRNMVNRSQETVPISNLPEYLKRIFKSG